MHGWNGILSVIQANIGAFRVDKGLFGQLDCDGSSQPSILRLALGSRVGQGARSFEVTFR